MTFQLLFSLFGFFFHLIHDLNSLHNAQRLSLYFLYNLPTPTQRVYKTKILKLVLSMETSPQAKRCTKLNLYGCSNVTRCLLAEKLCSQKGLRLAQKTKSALLLHQCTTLPSLCRKEVSLSQCPRAPSKRPPLTFQIKKIVSFYPTAQKSIL